MSARDGQSFIQENSMMSISANTFLQSMYEHKSQQRRLHNVRDYLLASLQINPHSHNLIVAIGNGNEKSNADALLNWLSGTSHHNSFLADLPAKEVKSLLLHHLQRTLDCWPD
ncbi:MAG: hypothetical protein CML22_02785 [Rheinheimera sp.]|jgi:hypothetical protein|nr:hypothetical protein [Rheinheimera sp.]MBM33217.1 hypothetical protein [Rheinheimera sp.]